MLATIGMVIAIIFVLELLLILSSVCTYLINKRHYESVRKRCLEIVQPLIETTVIRKHRVYKEKVLFKNKASIEAYKDQLIKECLSEIIVELSKAPGFDIREVEYDEVEYRLKVYVYTHIQIEIDNDYIPEEKKIKRESNQIDISSSLYDVYND